MKCLKNEKKFFKPLLASVRAGSSSGQAEPGMLEFLHDICFALPQFAEADF
jgi:hypothetical protein